MSDQNSVLASSVSAQQVTNKVLRNTYALLGITLIPTVIGALIGMSMNFSFAAQHPFIFAIGAMAVLYGLFAAITANRNSSVGVVLLLALTFLLGLMLGPILQHALHLLVGFGQSHHQWALAIGGQAIAFVRHGVFRRPQHRMIR